MPDVGGGRNNNSRGGKSGARTPRIAALHLETPCQAWRSLAERNLFGLKTAFNAKAQRSEGANREDRIMKGQNRGGPAWGPFSKRFCPTMILSLVLPPLRLCILASSR
jgi:hypothetical protein